MSTSRCLKCALDAARPMKRINMQAGPSIQIRQYANVSNRKPLSELRNPSSLQQGVEDLLKPPRLYDSPPPPKANGEASIANAESSEDTSLPFKIPTANVLATYRTPLKHVGADITVAQLQLRSFSVRNLEFFADFAMRVAQYLKLPATGPMPLPRRTERWTVIKSNFVHKKSQENFERITMRRLITIRGGHKDVVEIWLACLRKWQYYGVGMKANVWEHEGLDVAAKMDKERVEIEEELDRKLANFGWNNSAAGDKSIQQMLDRQGANIPGSPMTEIRDEVKRARNVDLFRDVQ